jgi:hypothetical protein
MNNTTTRVLFYSCKETMFRVSSRGYHTNYFPRGKAGVSGISARISGAHSVYIHQIAG